MAAPSSQLEDYQAHQRYWEAQAPFLRRCSARMGLQGKLVFSFMALLFLSLIVSCTLFITKSQDQLSGVIGEQARQIAYTLALAGKSPLANGDGAELTHIGQDLIKSRNILYVQWRSAAGNTLSLASRDPDLRPDSTPGAEQDVRALMLVQQRRSPLLGAYVQVTAPVLHTRGLGAQATAESSTQLVGYVSVAISETQERAQIRAITSSVLLWGTALGLLSLPLAYLLVRRIFFPIRQLVDATQRIAGGDLDAAVAINRPDLIGTLARSFNDMVHRVKMQQRQLEQTNRGLEASVKQRTGELVQVNEKLSAEIAEKDDFIRAVSHDLNAPLRNIAGMASMLLLKHGASFDEDITHRLQRIQKNVEMESDLIAELLELSRIKTRRQKMENIETAALVADLADVFENDLREKEIDLSVLTPLPVLLAEKSRIRQVFQNLIDNAIKYIGPPVAGRARRIEIGCELDTNGAEFFVRDNGMGIDPEDMEKIFVVFRRGRNSLQGNIAGKGVGLAGVKTIVRMYGGDIRVQSTPGEGSCFYFIIAGRHVPSLMSQSQHGNLLTESVV